MKINLSILLLLALLSGCMHTVYKDVPCRKPAEMPAELSPPAEFPEAIRKLNDYLKQHSTQESETPPG